MADYQSRYTGPEIDERLRKAGVAVLTEAQSLDAEGKAQARENIDAASSEALAGKVDKVQGKGLSTNDYTNTDKELVDALPAAIEGLQQAIAGKYTKPANGIPSTDMNEAVQTSLGKANTAVQPAALDAVTDLIPSAASSSNQLADKAFVNSSISTATATFRGSFNLVSDLSLTTSATQSQIATALGTAISTADNNDYAFVQIPTSDATPTEIARVESYKYNGSAWAFEYALNNSGFTATQWAALNSGITSGLVSKLSDLPTNSELTNLLAGKQPTIDSSHKLSYSLISDTPTIPAEVEANPTVPSGTTPTDLAGLKVGNSYYGIPQLPTVDNTPTANSNNLVKSGGVYSEVHPATGSAQPQGGMLPNKLYKLGTLTGNVTIAFASPADNTIENEYKFSFTAGTGLNLSWPSSSSSWKWAGNALDNGLPNIEDGSYYEVSVEDGVAIINKFE